MMFKYVNFLKNNVFACVRMYGKRVRANGLSICLEDGKV